MYSLFQPRDESFVFPNMFDTEEMKKEKEKEDTAVEETKKNFKQLIEETNKKKPGLSPWFS